MDQDRGRSGRVGSWSVGVLDLGCGLLVGEILEGSQEQERTSADGLVRLSKANLTIGLGTLSKEYPAQKTDPVMIKTQRAVPVLPK